VIHVSNRVPGERVRLVTQGQRSDDGSSTTLVIIHENGSWSIHGLGAPGVTLSKADMIRWPNRFWRVPGDLPWPGNPHSIPGCAA
jgi:hypothetical protein